MKKLLVVLMAIAMIATFSPVNAELFNVNGSGSGSINPRVDGDLVFSPQFETIPGGKAGGIGVARSSDVEIDLYGWVKNGKLILDGTVTSGAYAEGATWKGVAETDSFGTKWSYVGSSNYALGEVSMKVHAGVYELPGDNHQVKGLVIGDLTNNANAFEGTLNFAKVRLPGFFETEGNTGVIAGQAAYGGWDLENRGFQFFCWWIPLPDLDIEIYRGHYAGAGLDIGLTVQGGSFAESGRFLNTSNGQRTEGLFSNGGSWTRVNSWDAHDGSYDYDSHRAHAAISDVDETGWKAFGGTAMNTYQEYDGASAEATAIGSYKASGEFGDEFYGSAEGGTQTSIQILGNGTGSIRSASANMTVITTSNGSYQPPQD